jgi:cysteine desulfurase
MRSGTLPTPQIVGFARAIAIALETQSSEQPRILNLRQHLWQQLQQIDGIHLNGHATQRLAGNLNVSVEGVDAAALIIGLNEGIAVSSGAACSSTKNSPSHVLLALGRSEQLAYASIRFGIGRFNTAEEIDLAAECAIATIQSLRQAKIQNS